MYSSLYTSQAPLDQHTNGTLLHSTFNIDDNTRQTQHKSAFVETITQLHTRYVSNIHLPLPQAFFFGSISVDSMFSHKTLINTLPRAEQHTEEASRLLLPAAVFFDTPTEISSPPHGARLVLDLPCPLFTLARLLERD